MTESEPTRIALDPAVMAGKPVIRGTRIAVEWVLGLLAQGWTAEEVVAEYPGLALEDVRACLAYAHEVVRRERVFPTAA